MFPYPNNHLPIYPTYSNNNAILPEIQYVNSPESADAYNVPPNKNIVLFNQNNDEFYIVSSDASGSKTRNDFTFKAKEKDVKSEYATKGDLDDLKNEILKQLKKAPKEVKDE